MGIKPLRSLTRASSQNLHQKSQIIHFTDIDDYSPLNSLTKKSQIMYQSKQKIQQLYIQKQNIYYNSAQQLDLLNQYIFFLKNNSINMQQTNLYLPIQIRTYSQGMCQQSHLTQLYYPVYQYKLSTQLETRKKTNQNFHQSQIWYLIFNVLNAIRQFQRIKTITIQFNIDCVKFNNNGLIKIINMISGPKIMQKLRNQRLYWSHKNIINFYVQETYRLGLVLLQICTFVPISNYFQQNNNINNNNSQYNNNMQYSYNNNNLYSFHNNNNNNNSRINTNENIQKQIQKCLQLIKYKYSDLLYNLISIMLSHPKDRPLPSQIYQIFLPYKKQIMEFKKFNFNMSQFRNSIQGSIANYGNNNGKGSIVGIGMGMSDTYNNNFNNNNNNNNNNNHSMYNSNGNINNMYNSYQQNIQNNINNNTKQSYIHNLTHPYPQNNNNHNNNNHNMYDSLGNVSSPAIVHYNNYNQQDNIQQKSNIYYQNTNTNTNNIKNKNKYKMNNTNNNESIYYDSPLNINMNNSNIHNSNMYKNNMYNSNGHNMYNSNGNNMYNSNGNYNYNNSNMYNSYQNINSNKSRNVQNNANINKNKMNFSIVEQSNQQQYNSPIWTRNNSINNTSRNIRNTNNNYLNTNTNINTNNKNRANNQYRSHTVNKYPINYQNTYNNYNTTTNAMANTSNNRNINNFVSNNNYYQNNYRKDGNKKYY